MVWWLKTKITINNNFREKNIIGYPDRILLKFVEYSPEFLLNMFGFTRIVEGQ